MTLLFSIIILYTLLTLILVANVWVKKEIISFVRFFSFVILFLQATFITLRWLEGGHPPVVSTFDEGVLASFFLLLYSTLLDKKQHFVRFFVPFATISIIYGMLYYDGVRPIIPTEDGVSVYFHVFFVWLSYFFYSLAFVASIVCLMERNIFGAKLNRENLEEYIYKNILYGIVMQTIMFVLGAYHGAFVFGNWWLWDPVVFLCLISWFVYATLLHGVIFLGWTGKLLSKLSILGFIFTMLLYWSLVYINFSTFHVFDLSLKSH